MLFALLHFLSVMSRSLFLVSLPVAPAAGYGCPLPYLKIKATASKARENVSALRWLFFFAVVRQNEVIFFTYILYGKFVDFIKI